MSEDNNINRLLEEAAEKNRRREEEAWESEAPMEDAGARALADSLKSTRAIINSILIVFGLFLVKSLFFTVPSQETAVIRRFGKPVLRGESIFLDPGLHWRLPSPIDEVVRIPLNEQQTAESSAGWYFMNESEKAAALTRDYQPPGTVDLDPAKDGYTITADTNVLHINATMKYRVQAPEAFAFDFSDSKLLVENALNSALFHASAEYSVDDALDRKNALIQSIRSKAQVILDRIGVGVTIEQLTADIQPPAILRLKFAESLTASQERSQKIEEARGYAASQVAQARGNAEAIVNAAEAERIAIVSSVQSEADRFEDLLDDYRAGPGILTSRLLFETVGKIYANSREKFLFVNQTKAGEQLRIQLNREPRRPPVETAGESIN